MGLVLDARHCGGVVGLARTLSKEKPMKKADVMVGGIYEARVSGQLVPVRITAVSVHGGWVGVNRKTQRLVRIRTAGRLRRTVVGPPTTVADVYRQWQALKASNPGTVLLFRVDEDRFECYGNDATVCGEVLGLAVPTDFVAEGACFPAADLEDNIRRLVAAGHRVAVCERVQPGEARGKPVEKIIIPV